MLGHHPGTRISIRKCHFPSKTHRERPNLRPEDPHEVQSRRAPTNRNSYFWTKIGNFPYASPDHSGSSRGPLRARKHLLRWSINTFSNYTLLNSLSVGTALALSNQRSRGESFISQFKLRPEGGRGSARLSVRLMIRSFSVSFS